MDKREFDVVIWGATGFTGKLVAEYLAANYGINSDLNWAIAGRDAQKLADLKETLSRTVDASELPTILANSNDPDSLLKLAKRTRVVCTTVGPYALYGTPAVEACVAAGTHYCDLAGEVQWMAKIIANYQKKAEDSGARIVHTCGFDSIPTDMGTWFLQQAMLKKHGVAATQIKSRVGRTRGAASGGTIASMLNMMEEAKGDAFVRDAISNPYSLYPAGAAPGQDEADQSNARYDPDFQQWTAPFVMAAINNRVVRRTNALLGFPWGEDFRFDEALLNSSRFQARSIATISNIGMGSLSVTPLRNIAKKMLPKPGEGPSKADREAGYYELYFHGKHPHDPDKDMRAKVTGDMDPGYGSTSKMLAEAAVCLAKDKPAGGGGIWTPAAAMGGKLLSRLRENAGLTFEVISVTALSKK
ncbi:MAG: saccharopine dehydrogenase NADP-binding domain-containing protein [Halioglobus sp.]